MRFKPGIHRTWIRRIGVGWADALEPGVVTVEYAIVAALVAIGAMGAIQAFGGGVAHVFGNLLGHIAGMG